ncbi:MAG TPA: GntR family transcriptional regulator [Chthoniobacteraceae bacterium]|nr:GntR family transcriptional regulator [Chthoniobacteraceae bacterium]
MASQSETAYQRLRELILSAGVLPDTHLVEMEWAERLGLGRFAIREGLKRLHGEGLVTRNRGKYRVTVMTAEEIREISHLRAVLEVGALRFVREGIAEKVLEPIRAAAEDYAAFVKKGYYDGAREADLRFHRCLVATSENRRLIRLYEASNLPLLHVTVGRHPMPLDDFDIAAKEHTAICRALGKGEIAKASRLLEEHLKRGELEVTRGNH